MTVAERVTAGERAAAGKHRMPSADDAAPDFCIATRAG